MPSSDTSDRDAHLGALYLGAAFAFVFDPDGRFLLLEEQPDSRKYMYDLPGGKLTEGEEPLVGLQREVREETSLEIEIASPLCSLKRDIHTGTQLPILVAFYLARVVGDGRVETSPEHVGYRWVTPEEYWKYDLRVSLANEHVDTLLRYYQHLL